MGSSSSKFKKYLQHGDEFAAMQVTPHFIQATSVLKTIPVNVNLQLFYLYITLLKLSPSYR